MLITHQISQPLEIFVILNQNQRLDPPCPPCEPSNNTRCARSAAAVLWEAKSTARSLRRPSGPRRACLEEFVFSKTKRIGFPKKNASLLSLQNVHWRRTSNNTMLSIPSWSYLILVYSWVFTHAITIFGQLSRTSKCPVFLAPFAPNSFLTDSALSPHCSPRDTRCGVKCEHPGQRRHHPVGPRNTGDGIQHAPMQHVASVLCLFVAHRCWKLIKIPHMTLHHIASTLQFHIGHEHPKVGKWRWGQKKRLPYVALKLTQFELLSASVQGHQTMILDLGTAMLCKSVIQCNHIHFHPSNNTQSWPTMRFSYPMTPTGKPFPIPSHRFVFNHYNSPTHVIPLSPSSSA